MDDQSPQQPDTIVGLSDTYMALEQAQYRDENSDRMRKKTARKLSASPKKKPTTSKAKSSHSSKGKGKGKVMEKIPTPDDDSLNGEIKDRGEDVLDENTSGSSNIHNKDNNFPNVKI
jgi:hypothetical protein